MGQKRGFARYWARKNADPNFHSGTVGGARHNLLSEHGHLLAETMLFAELKREPARTSDEFARVLQRRGFPVIDKRYVCLFRMLDNACTSYLSALISLFTVSCFFCSWVLRAFEQMGFTSKQIKYRNALKFSLRNALYTARYLLGIQAFSWLRLKFLDEVCLVIACEARLLTRACTVF